MGSVVWGFIAGLLVSAIAAIVAFRRASRRLLLLERRARDAERLAELGTLTGGLAHEIKNPLSTVQLNLQLLREDLGHEENMNPRIVSRLETVQRETSRLRETLDDFLKYAGKLEVDRKPTELNNLLEDLVDFFTPQAQLHKVQLRLQRSPEELIAAIDPKLIKQAILNLMLNAIQAMPNGGELILTLRQENDQAMIDIVDTGSGISAETIAKIFDAYYSTKKGGTGLGLAMTRRIVLEHGGEISISSEPGKGSIFTVRLPLRQVTV